MGETQVNELLKPQNPHIEYGEPTLENVFVTRLRQKGSAPPFLQFPRSRGGNKSQEIDENIHREKKSSLLPITNYHLHKLLFMRIISIGSLVNFKLLKVSILKCVMGKYLGF